MYFTSKIEIDPSQITNIKRIKRDNVLIRLADILSQNVNDSKIELETFTVISILNQIKDGLEKLEIDNIIRLSINGFDFYLDKDEQEHDLDYAISNLDKKIDPIESERFENIVLVLEHYDDDFKYYISIKISRKHKVGEYPIKIVTNGLIRKFYTEKFDEKHIKDIMRSSFDNQLSFSNLIANYRSKFDIFNSLLHNFLSKFIKVDGVNYKIYQKILRPLFVKGDIRKINFNYNSEPAFHGYPGINKHFTYNLFWMELCRDNEIKCEKFILVDHNGQDALSFDNETVEAASSNIFNIKDDLNAEDLKDSTILRNGCFAGLLDENRDANEKFDDIYKHFHYDQLKVSEF
jgi:hypothetical protein